jgi:hypothetical protein
LSITVHIESIDYKVETYANLSRVEDCLITDELIYHTYKSTTSNYKDGIDEDQPPLFTALFGSEKEQWEMAIREEAEMLFKDTLIPIDRKSLPSNCKTIPTTHFGMQPSRFLLALLLL